MFFECPSNFDLKEGKPEGKGGFVAIRFIFRTHFKIRILLHENSTAPSGHLLFKKRRTQPDYKAF